MTYTAPIYIVHVNDEQSLLQQLQSQLPDQSMTNTACSSCPRPPVNAAPFNYKSANLNTNNTFKYRNFESDDDNKINLMHVKKRELSCMTISNEYPLKHITNDDESNHKTRSGSHLSSHSFSKSQLPHLCQFCNKNVCIYRMKTPQIGERCKTMSDVADK